MLQSLTMLDRPPGERPRLPVSRTEFVGPRPAVAFNVADVGGTDSIRELMSGALITSESISNVAGWVRSHGRVGIRLNNPSAHFILPFSGPVMGVAMELVWSQKTPLSATNGTIGLLGVGDAIFFVLGPFTGSLTNEVISVRKDTSRTGFVSASEAIYNEKTNILVARWNGTSYDLYWNGRKLPTTSGTTTHVPLAEATSLEYGKGSTAGWDIEYGPLVAYNHPISDDFARNLSRDIYLPFLPAASGFFFSASGGSVLLTVADCLHSQTADNVALTQASTLSVADSAVAHAADNVTLSVGALLDVADSLHSQTADNLDLTQAHTLSVADATHAQTADNVTLTQAQQLAVAECMHGHTVDGDLTLTQAYVLIVADALHAHAADTVDLSLGLALDPADTVHAHTVHSPALTQANVIAVADTLHAHAADAVTLSFGVVLVVEDTLHAHTADAVDLTTGQLLSVEDATHAHTADSPALTQSHVLIVSDTLHTVLSDNVSFGTIDTALGCVLRVPFYDRVFYVAPARRTH